MAANAEVREWNGLRILRLEDGGFVVHEAGLMDHGGMYTPFMYACTTTKEAIKYIEKKIGRDR